MTRPSQADELVATGRESGELFHDPSGTPYADVAAPEPAPHHEILRQVARQGYCAAMITDPSNFISQLVKYAGGGWGLACLIAGGVIGSIVTLRQGMPTKGACIQYDFEAPLQCAKYGPVADHTAWVNQGILGLIVGCVVGVVIYQAYIHFKPRASAAPTE